jgi:hypothetical protein
MAQAAGPPAVLGTWSSAVQASSARLSARIDPNGNFAGFHFEYLTQAAYEANGNSFSGAQRVPPLSEGSIANGSPVTVTALLFSLEPATTYRYRVVTNPAASPPDAGRAFLTQGLATGPLLPDARAWEMVSPVDKNGGQVDPPGAIAGGGVLQAAAGGGLVTYGSSASFAAGEGAPPASQYLATRTAGGWSTENITTPIFAGTYGTSDQGVPSQLFSPDLTRSLLFGGEHCRGGASGCAVANPPLAGSEAPAGYQDYYLREAAAFTALVGPADVANLDIGPSDFDLRLAGASSDLGHAVISSCAALSAGATEVPSGSGCDPAAQNLYEWSAGAGLSLINGTPGATLAAPAGAVSDDGSHVFWTDLSTGALHLSLAGTDQTVDAAGTFEAASSSGATAFFTKAGHLYRYDAAAPSSADLTPAGGVTGVLGADQIGATVYYQDATGLERWHAGLTTLLAPGAGASDPEDSPPATGTSRVSADGTRLLFVSKAPLTGYDNTDLLSGEPDSEVFLYDASAAQPLACLSCNPTEERPIGSATIPGARANGTAPGSTEAYKPRVLLDGGRRALFESADALTLTDTNTKSGSGAGVTDVYQWEAAGEGSCAKPGGCVSLISSGRSAAGATLLDASADGSDVFFLTDESLVGSDPGALDLYDARVGGGVALPPDPIPCEGDACQTLPPEPTDPTLTTLLQGLGNPPIRYVRHCRHGSVRRKGSCVRRHPHPRGRGSRR